MSDQGAGNRDRGGNGRRGGKRPFNRNGQRQDGRGRPDQNKPRPPAYRENLAQVVPPPPSAPPPACPVCGKPVTDISAAVAEKASKAPAHFDCVLASLQASEALSPQQRLVYLGSGCFAVVEGNPQTPQKFTIIRKIQYEERDAKPDWRKDLNRAIVR